MKLDYRSLPRFARLQTLWLAAACAACLFASTAEAVIIRSGATNNTPPPGDPGWANVGVSSTGGASVTYLGNGWILTANHVTIDSFAHANVGGPSNIWGVTFVNAAGAPRFDVDLASKHLLTNTDSSATDLALYKLIGTPSLPSLSISTSPMAVNDPLLLIGNGRTLGAQRNWNVVMNTPTNWTWTENGSPTTHVGFNEDGGNVIRWGTNVVSAANIYESDGVGNNVDAHATFDDNLAGLPNEAQLSNGDSGGPAFRGTALAGLMLAEGTFPNQPLSPSTGLTTAVFGNEAAIADLSFYRSQIVAIVPEPGSLLLSGLGVGALAMVGRRSRRSRIAGG